MSVTDPAEEYFKDGIWTWATSAWEKLASSGGRLLTALHGWDGAAWRNLAMLWGYSDVYREREFEFSVSSGEQTLTLDVVPAGEVWVINNFTARTTTESAGYIGLLANIDGTELVLTRGIHLMPFVPVRWTGHLVLKAGDYLIAVFSDCAAADDIYADAAGYKMLVAEDGDGVAAEEYVCVRDKKSQGTNGGTFTAGAWRTRTINDEQADAAGICSIADNQITLDAGTYRCLISCPAYGVGSHQARLYNVPDIAVELVGTSEYMATNVAVVTRSFIAGRFTLATQKPLLVQHRAAYTSTSVGFGDAANFTDEIYTVAEFWREA